MTSEYKARHQRVRLLAAVLCIGMFLEGPAVADTLPLRTPPSGADVPVYRPSDARPLNSLPIPESGVESPETVPIERSRPSTIFDRCRTLPGVGDGSNRPSYCKGIRKR